MLIRYANSKDKKKWISLAKEIGPIFRAPNMETDPDFLEYMDSKISKSLALVAVDRMSNKQMGFIGFSTTYNRITWFGVFSEFRNRGIGSNLLKCCLNQLDWTKDITVETYPDHYTPGLPAKSVYRKMGFKDFDKNLRDKLDNEIWKMVIKPQIRKKGGSFHHNYLQNSKMADTTNCPVCQNEQHPEPPVLIKEFPHSWMECFPEAQGRLFGKCHVLSKIHSEHFFDLSRENMSDFMHEVQIAAKALHEITGAVKINYEIHGNSLPHLHVHLFPRYLDDDFPGKSIDYNIHVPSPYESKEEFNWFIEKMKGCFA